MNPPKDSQKSFSKLEQITKEKHYPNNSISPSVEVDTVKLLSQTIKVNFEQNKKSYISDTLRENNFEFVVFGKINSPDITKSYLYTAIDSLEVIEPFHSIIKIEDSNIDSEIMGGYLYKSEKYSFKNIIKIRDVNLDKRKDIEVFCEICSGNSGYSVFSQFLNNKNQFIFSKQKSY